jgi:signal transduction histidine kinase
MASADFGSVSHAAHKQVHPIKENAWKFTGKHEKASIEFGVTEQEAKKAYFVRDDGAAFDMRYVGKLFGTFQRLHGGMSSPGNGVGLAIIQRILLHHYGQVWAEGKIEKGATFRTCEAGPFLPFQASIPLKRFIVSVKPYPPGFLPTPNRIIFLTA